MEKVEEASVVIFFTPNYIYNVFVYEKYDDAVKKVLETAKSWYDKDFEDIDDFFDWQTSEEFLDMGRDFRIGLETSVLEYSE